MLLKIAKKISEEINDVTEDNPYKLDDGSLSSLGVYTVVQDLMDEMPAIERKTKEISRSTPIDREDLVSSRAALSSLGGAVTGAGLMHAMRGPNSNIIGNTARLLTGGIGGGVLANKASRLRSRMRPESDQRIVDQEKAILENGLLADSAEGRAQAVAKKDSALGSLLAASIGGGLGASLGGGANGVTGTRPVVNPKARAMRGLLGAAGGYGARKAGTQLTNYNRLRAQDFKESRIKEELMNDFTNNHAIRE